MSERERESGARGGLETGVGYSGASGTSGSGGDDLQAARKGRVERRFGAGERFVKAGTLVLVRLAESLAYAVSRALFRRYLCRLVRRVESVDCDVTCDELR